jgi:hypothetical protein
MAKITVEKTDIAVVSPEEQGYICMMDMIRAKTGRYGGTYAHKRELAKINYHIHTDAIKEQMTILSRIETRRLLK